jgi:hypothetical protein
VIHARHGPILVVIFAASLWGLFWLPLRGFEEMGLAAGWATLSQLSTPALFLVPLALWRATGGRATGLGQPVTGLLIGGAFALYAESLLLTGPWRLARHPGRQDRYTAAPEPGRRHGAAVRHAVGRWVHANPPIPR